MIIANDDQLDIKILEQKEKELLDNLTYVYLKNKCYFIRAEELLESLKFYLAPLVQHRDALDHIMRGFESIGFKDEVSSDEVIKHHKKCVEQLDKALGHELRSFFDIADFVCIKIRLIISERIKRIRYKKIKNVWVNYDDEKKEIYEISERIAEVRLVRGESIKSVDAYCQILDRLFEIYKDFITNVEPKLKRGLFLKSKSKIIESKHYRISG